MSRFPVAFRLPAFASRVILSPLGDWAFLTVGLPPGLSPDPNGVSTFRTHEIRPGWVPSVPRGRRCSHGRQQVSGRRLPHPNGQSLHPGRTSIIRGST